MQSLNFPPSIPVGRAEREVLPVRPRLVDRPREGRACQEPRAVGADPLVLRAVLVDPVGVEERRRRRAVGEMSRTGPGWCTARCSMMTVVSEARGARHAAALSAARDATST